MRTETAFCDFPWTRLKVSSGGEISNCCWQQIGIGNILEKSFTELWTNNKILKDIRIEIKKGDFHELCSEFGSCPYMGDFKHPDWGYDDFPIWSKKEKTFDYDVYPSMIELDLPNTICNIGPGIPDDDTNPACIMCIRRLPGFVVDTTDIFKKICERVQYLLPFAKRLHLQGYSEPFYKNLIFDTLNLLDFDMFKKITALTTTSNGTYLNEKNGKLFNDSSYNTALTISIDAGNGETYRKIRMIDGYDLVIKNLIRYNKYRDKEQNNFHINNNINMLNVSECVKMVEDASKIGVDSLKLFPTNSIDSITKKICINKSNKKIFEENFELAQLRADELGVNIMHFLTKAS